MIRTYSIGTQLKIESASYGIAPALSIDIGSDVGPDRFDLAQLQYAPPRRHLALSIQHHGEETVTIGGAQSAKVGRPSATGVSQLLAVAVRAVVGVHHRAGRDLFGIGFRPSEGHDGGQREDRPRHRGQPHALHLAEYSSNSLNVHRLPPAGTLARLGSPARIT